MRRNADSKSLQKVHKLHKNENVEIFRPLWSHFEVFLKQNAETFSSEILLRSFLTVHCQLEAFF